MKLTHKAIARSAGYRVKSDYVAVGRYTLHKLMFAYHENSDEEDCSGFVYDTEEAAYKACCEDNQLIEEE